MQDKATERPWRFEDADGKSEPRWIERGHWTAGIRDASGLHVCSTVGTSQDECVGNARLIVRAVNAHDAMREAILHAIKTLRELADSEGSCAYCNSAKHAKAEAKDLEAALSRAQED